MKIQRNKGFSLLEMMVVVGILGVLAAIALPMYSQYVERADLAAAKQQVIKIQQTVESERLLSPRGFNVGEKAKAPAQQANNQEMGKKYLFSVGVAKGAENTLYIQAVPKKNGYKYGIWADMANTYRCTGLSDKVLSTTKPSSCEKF